MVSIPYRVHAILPNGLPALVENVVSIPYRKHAMQYNKEAMQFYNSAIWRKTSKMVLLTNDYICAVCGGEATMTDHVISIKKDWSKRLDWDNLQPICKACNDAKGSWN